MQSHQTMKYSSFFAVDDLFATLDIHVASLPKVSVIRLRPSHGLMVARQTGIERSRSDYFVVMDSHMEVVTGICVFCSISVSKHMCSEWIRNQTGDVFLVKINSIAVK